MHVGHECRPRILRVRAIYCGACGDAVDIGFRATALSITRRTMIYLVIRQIIGLQPGIPLGGEAEFGADIGLLCSFTHHAGIAAATECEGEGIDQYRFAGTQSRR